MRKFLAKHAAATTGTLSCFDRLLFKGHLPLGYPHAMEVFLTLRGVLFKDLKAFVLKQADRLKAHAQAMAEGAGYARLLRHATLCLRAEDVLTFLGRKLHGGFTGEILNEWKRRWPGARVKHWMKGNWIKMYDKHGSRVRGTRRS